MAEPLSSQEMDLKDRNTTLTRRIVLTGGAGCALTLIIPRLVRGAVARGSADADTGAPAGGGNSELYVYRSSDRSRTVLAATWTAPSHCESELRVHAGAKSWTVEVRGEPSIPIFSQQDECQLFSGDVLDRVHGHGARLKAVVIEAPTHIISSGRVAGVWAERFSQDGTRVRFGSAFMARLVATDPAAAKLYHASSPTEDGEELTQRVAKAIAANARASGYTGNASAYGLRVASAITPDAVLFDPISPVGFTFAAQNGRHPDDPVQSVVDSVLHGTLTPRVSPPSLPLEDRFPYFPQPTRV